MTDLDARTALQLELLRRMETLDPPVHVLGGYAEDALLAGTVLRPHDDIDWLYVRREHDVRLRQARALGFPEFGTWGESAPGEPFYLSADEGGLRLELGVVDEEDGALWLKVHKLAFDLDGADPPAGYRIALPPDTFRHPPVQLDGITIWPVSPLALYQFRIGIASQGSFGELGEKQLSSLRRLRARFFADRADDELQPRVEPLPS